MVKSLVLLFVLGGALALGGCAHPLTLSPNLTALAGTGTAKITKNVGLLITEDDKKLEVTSPGGGGDKVRYFPYRDLEAALYVALSESFASVSRGSGPTDAKVQSESLSYIVTPRVQTTSSSDSVLTWPPTLFTVELNCLVADSRGARITEVRVVGEGRATFDEFKVSGGALSANRAAEDAVKKLIKALGETAVLR